LGHQGKLSKPIFIAAGLDDLLCDGLCHTHPGGVDPSYSNTKNVEIFWTPVGEDEVFEKEVVSWYRKILPNLRYFIASGGYQLVSLNSRGFVVDRFDKNF